MSTSEVEYLRSKGRLTEQRADEIKAALAVISSAGLFTPAFRLDKAKRKAWQWPLTEYFDHVANLLYTASGNPLDDDTEVSVLKCEAQDIGLKSAHPGQDRYWLTGDKHKKTYALEELIAMANTQMATLSRNLNTSLCNECKKINK